MNQEELDQLKGAADFFDGPVVNIIHKALAYIDSQAEQIKRLDTEAQNYHDRKEELAAEVERLSEDNHYLGQRLIGQAATIGDLLINDRKQRTALKKLGEMCRARGEEIKRLEDALVEERAKHVAVSRLTDEQRAALQYAVENLYCTEKLEDFDEYPEDVLRGMLEEGNP